MSLEKEREGGWGKEGRDLERLNERQEEGGRPVLNLQDLLHRTDSSGEAGRLHTICSHSISFPAEYCSLRPRARYRVPGCRRLRRLISVRTHGLPLASVRSRDSAIPYRGTRSNSARKEIRTSETTLCSYSLRRCCCCPTLLGLSTARPPSWCGQHPECTRDATLHCCKEPALQGKRCALEKKGICPPAGGSGRRQGARGIGAGSSGNGSRPIPRRALQHYSRLGKASWRQPSRRKNGCLPQLIGRVKGSSIGTREVKRGCLGSRRPGAQAFTARPVDPDPMQSRALTSQTFTLP